MTAGRFGAITGVYSKLRVAVVGDFFLDRYLLIDPSKAETSIETGLPVHNVVAVRGQPGAAGTIVNNLSALGVGSIHAVGFCGDDGEGYELRRALSGLGVDLDHFLTDPSRRTPVYCKPMLVEDGQPPRELNRLDSKNWTETGVDLRRRLASGLLDLSSRVDAIILMDQVELPETGVVTRPVKDAALASLRDRGDLVVLADSRRGFQGYPPLGFKMNADEFGRLTGTTGSPGPEEVRSLAGALARANRRPVFVTLADRGIVGALPDRPPEHVPAFPVRGPIDVVGAGDSVTANLAASLAAGANLREAMELAMAAASVVVHELATTGTANLTQIARLLDPGRA